MKLIIWFLCLAVGGSFAFHCDERERCDDGILEEMMELQSLPNKEQLPLLCPRYLGYIDCYIDAVKKCIIISIPELAELGYKYPKKLLAARSFFDNLCNENSTLRNDYESNIDCILSVTNPKSLLYEEEAGKLVINFSESKGMRQTSEKDRETIMNTLFCLEIGFLITSLAHDIEKNCNKRAHDLYLTMQNLTDIVEPVDCTTESVLNLKREFLDSLTLEDDKEDFWSIYRMLRRR